jgi:hypothetical protein
MAVRPIRRPPLLLALVLALGLVWTADVLLFDTEGGGLSIGLTLLAFVVAAAVAHPDLSRNRAGAIAVALAMPFALLQVEHFSPLAWLLFWTALGCAVIAASAEPDDGAFQWAQRLAVLGLKGLVAPLIDLREALEGGGRSTARGLGALALTLALPVLGAIVFLWLFAVANPLIEGWFASLRLPKPDLARLLFWGFVGLLAWGTLRPRFLGRTLATPEAEGDLELPGVTPASVILSLAVFNAVFALQNGLDLAFLWSGARLPPGMSFAEYAHRGAYPLIATALLAGGFVLVFLRPGSATASRPLVRWLVAAWLVQNVFLVASTALRTADYVEAYSLTRLRLAALVWMALVAVGLALIGWRLARGKSARWLVDANVAAAFVALTLCSVIDLGAVAAAWNVRHARDVGGTGAPLDVCYLEGLGSEALVSLALVERQPLAPDLQVRVAAARTRVMDRTVKAQAHWRSWTWRDARRLSRAQALTAGLPRPVDVRCQAAR